MQCDIEDLGGLRKGLLEWYDESHRSLPWRINVHCKNKSAEEHRNCNGEHEEENRAYRVWVSEMMLQQTRVSVVREYFHSWMKKWPTLYQLARATQEEVNTVWAGLGYYRRARFLLEGAKYITENCDGNFPQSVTDLQKIPGVGKYTAGAISSIVFKQHVPVVDGNVIRVLSRLYAISADSKAASTVKLFWEIAETLVDSERPGDFNQALMELGATICKPTSPSCENCPLSHSCKAFTMERVTDFPVKSPKAQPRQEHAAVCAVYRGSSLLFVQRPKQGLLAGLWEFPSVKLEVSSLKLRKQAMDKYLSKTLGLTLGKGVMRQYVGEYTHVFSHIRLDMYIEWMQISSDETVCLDSSLSTKWVSDLDIMDMGLTSGMKKVLEMVSEHRGVPDRKRKKRNSE